MIQATIILWILLGGPVLLFFYNRHRTVGKILCYILEEDRSVRSRLIKVEGDFLNFGGNRYLVNPDAVRLMRYPAGWPSWIQQIVPVCLYKVEESTPLDWNTQMPVTNSSSALATVMEPEWLKLIVRGTREGATGALTGGNRVLTVLGVGASVLVLVMMFYLISRIGALEAIVKSTGG